MTADLAVYSTAPQSVEFPPERYRRAVEDAAEWSERHGCRGILIYADNRLVDPWLVAHLVVRATEGLWPLVAVQPVYSHPYTVAKLVASLGFLYGRRVVLNMVAGGFKNDLLALADGTPHDRRYERLVEYTTIVARLLNGEHVTLEGEFYVARGLTLSPRPDPSLHPRVFVSGSSEAGLRAARALGATAIRYPLAPGAEPEAAGEDAALDAGLRVGIIARDDADEAWRIALARFPPDRKGRLTHELAMRTSDSHWHRALSQAARREQEQDTGGPYWLVPFQHYKTFCPYLVGSYEQVAAEVSRYVKEGSRTFILDIPREEEDLYHSRVVFARALAALGA